MKLEYGRFSDIIIWTSYLSLLFSCSVVCDSLRFHGLQNTRLPCPPLSPRVCSNSCSSSQWCHPTVSASVAPFFSCPQSVQHQGLFQWVMPKRRGKMWKQWQTIFLGSKITADSDCSHEMKRYLLLGRKTMTNLASILKSRHMTAHKGPYSQSNGFPSRYVQMWELVYKQGWVLKNGCFQTVVLEKTLQSPLDSKKTSQT